MKIPHKWYVLTEEEHVRLNPPHQEMRYIEHELWFKYLKNPAWMYQGYAPPPRSRWGWFFYHIMHGLIMHYPLRKIILYAIAHDTINWHQEPNYM